MTGCSVLDGTMSFEEKTKSLADWLVVLHADGRSTEIKLKDRLYSGADEVLSLEDEQLFTSRDIGGPVTG